MMRDRPVDLDLLFDRTRHQRLVAPRDPPRANRIAQFVERAAIARNQQRPRGAVVQPMQQPALQRLLANGRDIGKPRDDRVHHGVALFGMDRMARHAARFVHDDHGRILVENFERQIGVRLDHGAAIGRRNFNSILDADHFALL